MGEHHHQRHRRTTLNMSSDMDSDGGRKQSFQVHDSGDDDERRSLFLKKASRLPRLRKARCSLAAFSELSLSRSSFRLEQDDDRVRVEYYVNENTVKERLHLYFFKNQRSSLRIRIARFVLKLFTCVLYIVRVIMDDDPTESTCYGCPKSEKPEYLASLNLTEEEFLQNPIINWEAIFYVNRPMHLWIIHVTLALISFSETILLLYLNYKGNIFQQLLTRRFMLELCTSIPFIVSVSYSPLRHLFVPVFLNCWLAKYALENMFNDLHRAMQRSQSALSQQLTILSATLICLVFTSVCGVQHFQRAGHRRLNLFQSTYFVVVTFSTVGYGDFVPDIWPAQLFMVAMIGIALIVLPTQFEQLAFTWMERQKLGGSYSSHRAQNEKHVVVCSTTLHADTIMDFLNEFYAHPLLQDYFVVLLSPMELDTILRMILQVPIWAQRVIYIQGSCLKDADLTRARMGEAEACFILAARNYADKTAADEHTILRSWAVKDFAPMVPQYVQILRPENKLHVRFAEHIVCEDEFKYALLANNCLFPGTSTLVTLLLHTSRGQEGELSREEWQKLYGKCSGNEIYHIRLGDSRFFGEYEGKSFTYASFHSHRKFGVCLVGVRPAQLPEFYEDTILLNPGPRHIMRKSDICFYLSITKEEHSAFVTGNPSNSPTANAPMGEGGASNGNQGQNPADSQNQQEQEKSEEDDSGDNMVEHSTRIVVEMDERTESHIFTIPNSIGIGGGGGEGDTSTNVTTTTIQIAVDQTPPTPTEPKKPRKDVESSFPFPSGSSLGVQSSTNNSNLLSLPTVSDQRSANPHSRRPSILPVPESFPATSSPGSQSPHHHHGTGHHGSSHGHLGHRGQDSNALVPSTGTLGSGGLGGSLDGGGTSDEADDEVSPWIGSTSEKTGQVIKGFPPVSPYIGVTPTLCYLLREKKPLCCLQLAQACEHCVHRNAYDYNWQNNSIIMSADYASTAIYNFIVPLRAHFRPKSKLNPIILLLERRPDTAFLDAVSHFPMIYWMLGSIDCLDDLLRAGITLAENVVVVNKELSNSAEEDTLSDCNTIVAVQTMFRFFPHIKIITELSQSSNMRFMQFRAHDTYALHLSRMEKREKERGSHISYMFRLPFAAGSVFSASMLDTLLYQAFVKDYLITFVRLLLGIDQAPGSGFLTSMQLTRDDLWIRTYGRLYQKLCSTTCEIPIGIYRTQDSHCETEDDVYERDNGENFSLSEETLKTAGEETKDGNGGGGGNTGGGKNSNSNAYGRCFRGACGSEESSFTSAALEVTDETRDSHAQNIERAEITNLVSSRMASLGLPLTEQDSSHTSEKRSSLSYVIINPSCDLKIKENDIIYLIRPSPFSAKKTFERHNSRRKSTLNPTAAGGAGTNSNLGGAGSNTGGPSSTQEELQKAAFSIFSEQGRGSLSGVGAGTRRRSSAGSVGYTSTSFFVPPTSMPPNPSVNINGGFRIGLGGVPKSNSLSLPDSPRKRSNSLRTSHNMTDDILLRRSNSLRQGLGHGQGHGHHYGSRRYCDEIGLPTVSRTVPATPSSRHARINLNGCINFEVTVTDESSQTGGGITGDGNNPSSAVTTNNNNSIPAINTTNNLNNNINTSSLDGSPLQGTIV